MLYFSVFLFPSLSSSCCFSLFQIFYDQESEVLLSHNCSSHVQKVEVRAAKTHPIEWNSVPLAVVCAFPYILAFSTDAIEFRYAVNGSLLQTLGMPELQLITAKVLKHTILKVKFLSKNSNLTKNQHFYKFFAQIFLAIFLVKSKLSTAKKSKTTTFSRVFHPNKIDNFFGKSKLNFWTKNEDFEQCVKMTRIKP